MKLDIYKFVASLCCCLTTATEATLLYQSLLVDREPDYTQYIRNYQIYRTQKYKVTAEIRR